MTRPAVGGRADTGRMTEHDRVLLNFEDAHPMPGPLKVAAIRLQLGLSAARYQQRLIVLLRSREALEGWPQLVHRWERQTAAQARLRGVRGF
jgi:hypothetical protein